MQEAVNWRWKAGIQWASLGDTSPVFFFRTMKECHKRESMTQVMLDNDSYITSAKEIMEELVRFYTTLFSQEKGFQEI